MPKGSGRRSQQHMVRSVTKVAFGVEELAVLETLSQGRLGTKPH